MHMIDRRTARSDALLCEILHIIDKHLGPAPSREIRRELKDLLYVRGVQVITEYERAQAGLSARNADGYTLEELRAYEGAMMMAMLKPLVANFSADDTNISATSLLMRERAK